MRKIDFIRQINVVEPATQLYNYVEGLGGSLFQYHDLDMRTCLSHLKT